MVKRKSAIALGLLFVVIAVILFCTIGNTIYSVDQINKIKDEYSRYRIDTEKYDRMIFATVCTYFIQGIVMILPALTAFHFICTVDDKNAIAFAKARKQKYSGHIKNHGLPVMIEALVGAAVCLVLSIFSGSTNGWGDDYSVNTFFQMLLNSSAVCGIHLINAFIISAFDDHNRIRLSEINGDTNGYGVPPYAAASQTYYGGYNNQPPVPQMQQPSVPQMQQPSVPQQYNGQYGDPYNQNMRRY